MHAPELTALIEELRDLAGADRDAVERIVRRHPKDGCGFFSKSEIIAGFRYLNRKYDRGWGENAFLEVVRMKPVRTLSGVAPVTVLTKPFPCPGKCIFCPSDVRMPKSYLSDEPGAQRAAQHQFDPYLQTRSRLQTYHNIGHRVDKVELIILGGTWSSYPEEYQIWFVKRCFDAMNDFSLSQGGMPKSDETVPWMPSIDFRENQAKVVGGALDQTYNQVVNKFVADNSKESFPAEVATWSELGAVQRVNESAEARCIGLVVETRPDHLSLQEVIRIRRLGATKVQIGIQSLSDEVLRMNHRGHDVAATRRALHLLRQAGFKIHAHWMPNLYGSTPEKDLRDFEKLFSDPDFCPDELKIYPCSLIESAELMSYYQAGAWRPYTYDELLDVLVGCLERTPEYCRLTRVIRDIPGTDIVEGNRLTNFRELAEERLHRNGGRSKDIRAREVRNQEVSGEALRWKRTDFPTSIGSEVFLQMVTPEDQIAGFLRLALPRGEPSIDELNASAIIREVHVYGLLMAIGERQAGRSQHLGLGSFLIDRAEQIAAENGYQNLAVISSVGTRQYYRGLGFVDDELYQHRKITAVASTSTSAPGQPLRFSQDAAPSS
jgi:elongator complex protein 3